MIGIKKSRPLLRAYASAAWAWGLLLPAALCGATPSIEVLPSSISLDGSLDSQSIVVRGADAGGVSRDLTAQARLSSTKPELVAITGRIISPRADGEAAIVVNLDELSVEVPLRVRNAGAPRAVRFGTDIMPILAKTGCNSGTCHGSARGQDGFHLSLFGYDPRKDYHTLTRELPGRRINIGTPEDSLVLQKATGRVPHTGGRRFTAEDEHFATMAEWIHSGAPADPADLPRVTGLELFPRDMLMEVGATQRFLVQARYSDGSDRDVTRLAVFISNNEACATVDAAGVASCGARGEALLLARFDAFTADARVIVVPSGEAAIEAPMAANNYVDERINDKLRRMRIQPSEPCSDEAFLRRVYLDIVGLLPTIDEIRRFMEDASPDRRAKLVDELLARKEFVEVWVMKWAERLAIRTTPQVSYKAMLQYHSWLQERIASGAPINRIVAEIVASQGGTFTQPAANFYQLEQDTLKLSENVAQAFLGVRTQCAQCHNHPFDRWTMDDYYGFAAFFAQVGRKAGEDPRETILFNNGSGDVRHPVGGRVMAPRFLGGPAPELAGRDRRAVLAEWLADGKNGMFSRSVANFVWAHFFHRGIVEPVDDFRISNPPSNPALLDALADRLAAENFDLRTLVRDICTSRAYQRATAPNPTNEGDASNFSRAAVRRIRAETLLDCISQVTQTRDKFPGLPLGARAVQIADGNVGGYFLTTFGRARRESVCTCEVVMEPSLSQALHLVNGETIHGKIKEGGLVRKLIEAGRTPDQIVEHLYLSCLTRGPTEAERAAVGKLLADSSDLAVALEDFFWAILNSKEFVFNH